MNWDAKYTDVRETPGLRQRLDQLRAQGTISGYEIKGGCLFVSHGVSNDAQRWKLTRAVDAALFSR